MAASMKGSGTEILGMARASKGILMAILTSDSLSMVKRMAKESIPGKTGRSMMGSGTKDLSKDMVSGKVYRMIPT